MARVKSMVDQAIQINANHKLDGSIQSSPANNNQTEAGVASYPYALMDDADKLVNTLNQIVAMKTDTPIRARAGPGPRAQTQGPGLPGLLPRNTQAQAGLGARMIGPGVPRAGAWCLGRNGLVPGPAGLGARLIGPGVP